MTQTVAFDTLGYTKDMSAYDDASRKELATRLDLKELELRLQAEAQKNKYDLLKWQIGIGLALVAVMAKGFGWLGF